jgi:predicted DNA binding protein
MRAPEGAVHPIFDLLTRGDHVERVTGLDWNFSGDRLGILHYIEGEADAYVEDLESIPAVLDYDVARTDDEHFYVYHRCVVDGGARALFETFTQGSLLLVPPVEFGDDGSATFSLFGDDAEVQAAVESIPEPVAVEVHEVSGMAETPEVTAAALSARQREAVDVALALGYYHVPREASYEDVAAAMDCAPSTAAEHLRKAEATLVRSAFDGYGR